MAPSPIPAPLPKWAKAIIELAPFVVTYLEDLLTYKGDHDVTDHWRKLALHWHYTATGGTPRDDVYCTFDIANITGGSLDDSWTTGDYTTCEAAIDTMVTALNSHIPNCYQLVEYRWYRRKFNDYTEQKPFADSGPPERVTAKAITGGTANVMPTQTSMSITEKTAFPRHWGRFYLPVSGGSDMTTARRFDTAAVDAVANAVGACYATLQTAEFFPVVPVTQVDKAPARGLLQVTAVQVDDVPDVQRRRRLSQTSYRKIVTP